MSGLEKFVTRYVAVWNEPDTEKRSMLIPHIWSPEVSLFNRLREYHGFAGVERATARSFDLFGSRGFTFRERSKPDFHHGAIRFAWVMLDPAGAVDSLGTQFLVLANPHRIALDYQFLDPPPTTSER